jgi:WD40 repeat protein
VDLLTSRCIAELQTVRLSMTTKRAVRVIGFAIFAAACSNDSPVAPTTTTKPESIPKAPVGVLVSDPHQSTSSSGAARNVVYVSVIPGTFQDAQEVVITNATRPVTPRVAVGASFDPIAIEAEAADDLILTLSAHNGVKSSYTARVPLHAPPRLVRTDPLTSQVDVATDSRLHAVFSEPLDPSTVNASSVTLNANAKTLAATVTLTAGGCEILVTPDDRLASDTDYSLWITSDVRDLDGEPLAQQSIASFVTADGAPLIGKIVFTGPDFHIYVRTADGSSVSQLTRDGHDFNPAWSPDGKRIAFARNVRGPENNGFGITDIYTMAADGTDLQRRTVNGNFSMVTWSPDGKTLAISNALVYYGSIFLISAFGEIEPPVFFVGEAQDPAWSPDGKQFAYIHLSGDDSGQQLFVLNVADPANPKPITEEPNPWDPWSTWGAAWSPDGSRLAFTKCNGSCAVYTIDKFGGSLARIVDGSVVSSGAWSPDGKRIVFTARSGKIAYVNASGGPVHEMSPGSGASWHQ